ncbi:MAG: DUF4258 domain-containing protein [Myxococcota bacterium]
MKTSGTKNAGHPKAVSFLLAKCIRAAKTGVYFSSHAVIRMRQRCILPSEIVEGLPGADVVDEYPDDERGESVLCLISGDRPFHVHVAPKPYGLVVVTCYEPGMDKWCKDLKTRRKR